MADFTKAKKKAEERKRANSKKPRVITTKRHSYPVWALFLVPFLELYEIITEKADQRRQWSEEKATKVLDAILPNVLEYSEDEKTYYYCLQWGNGILVSNAPIRYRKWARKFSYRLSEYLVEFYENENYVKTFTESDFDDWIAFSEK